MASASRPKRARRQPDRFGAFEQPSLGEENESEESGSECEPDQGKQSGKRRRPQKSARTSAKHARAADSSDEEFQDAGSGSDSEGSEEEMEVDDSRPSTSKAAKPRATASIKGPGINSVRLRAAPPMHPVSASAFLSTLHACPNLIESLIADDDLRTPTLVVRDCANLAIALGAAGEMAADWWRQLAAKHAAPGAIINADTPVSEALAVVKKAVRADPSRMRLVTKTDAKTKYRLSDKDLGAFQYRTRPNRLFWNAQPAKLFSELDCRGAAHKKWGCPEGMDAARQKAKATAAKVKATLGSREDERREEMGAALKAAGLDPSGYKIQKRKEVKGYIKRGIGSATAVAVAIAKEQKAAQEQKAREAQLRSRLHKEGLPFDLYSDPAQSFINSGSMAGLEAVVSAIKAAHKKKKEQEDRSAEIKALFVAQGLPSHHLMYPSVLAYIRQGEGTAAAVAAECRAREEAAAARRARRQRMHELLQEEQLPYAYTYSVSAVSEWIEQGTGSEATALAAARQQFEEAEAARLAREERRAHMSQLLAAEHLPESCLVRVCEIVSYINTNTGSVEAAMEAACSWHQQQQEQEQRRLRVRQLLVAEGVLEANSPDHTPLLSVSGVSKFILRGEGTEAEAVAAARAHHEQMQARQQREAALTELLAAEGIQLEPYRYSNGVYAYIQQGTGTVEAAVAAAKVHVARNALYADIMDDEEYYGFDLF